MKKQNQKYFKFIKANVTARSALEQLAEEAAELSQAALKYIRANGLALDNPTPVTQVDALVKLHEELDDVLMCFDVAFEDKTKRHNSGLKWQRWAKRLGYTEEESNGKD